MTTRGTDKAAAMAALWSIGLWARSAAAELDPPAPPAPATPALTEGQVAGLGVVAGLMAAGVLAEAAAGVISTVGVAEAGALTAGIGHALAQGGVAGTVAAVSITTVTVATVAISLLALGIVVVVLAPKLAESLRANHPQRAPSITTGEQTDAMHQAIQQAAELEANPQGALSLRFSLGGRGDDAELEEALTAAITDGLTLGDVPGLGPAPGPCCPGTGMSLNFVDVVADPAPPATPGLPTDPGPGLPSDPGGLDGLGLFMVIDEGNPKHVSPLGTVATLKSVPSPAAWWLLVSAGTLAWVIRRRCA